VDPLKASKQVESQGEGFGEERREKREREKRKGGGPKIISYAP
jgi:hypothetical protein